MPKLMVDELMGRPVPDKLMPFKELMVVRYWTEHYFDPQRVGGAVPPALTWLVRHGQSASKAGLPRRCEPMASMARSLN